jgi:RND family efflux transporter MFP subunit
MKTKTIVGVIFATATVSFVAWSRWNNEKQAQTPGALPLAVKIQTIEPAPITQTLTVSGTLVGENEAVVISETNGKVTAVKAQIGDWLVKGQTIVQVENDLKFVALEQAKAQLLAAQTNYDKTQKDLKRYDDLFTQQIATQNDIENARLAARASEAQLKSAEAALKLAQRHYDDTFIKAPLTGRLADRYVNEAAMLTPGDKIGVVVDSRNVKLKTSVAENEIALIKVGQPAEVIADALSIFKFSGKVLSVAQKTNSERTYPIEILTQNGKDEPLKSGMFGRATIHVATASQALVVPSAAVLSAASGHYVFVEENGRAVKKHVQLGVTQDGQVQIISGLAIGERLVVSGQQRLTEGATVIVQQ